jgi:ADP-ribose pyrophosphatase YjhB (NUDIX family)
MSEAGHESAGGSGKSTELDLMRRVLALARTGLHFTGTQYRSDGSREFDRERYEEIGQLAAQWLASHSHAPLGALLSAWQADDGYVTPKVDVRGAAFRNDRVLLVRERSDGKWTLPGGWGDVNETPSQGVEKEILQESGFTARAVKLAAVYDRRTRNAPPSIFYIWKLFFLCEITGGEPRISNETDAVDFFPLDALPPLSTGRVVQSQIERMYAHHRDPSLPTDFD